MTEKEIGFGRESTEFSRNNILPLDRVVLPGALANFDHDHDTSMDTPFDSPKIAPMGDPCDAELARIPTFGIAGHIVTEEKTGDLPILSRTRMVLLASGMMLTYFLGVSSVYLSGKDGS